MSTFKQKLDLGQMPIGEPVSIKTSNDVITFVRLARSKRTFGTVSRVLVISRNGDTFINEYGMRHHHNYVNREIAVGESLNLGFAIPKVDSPRTQSYFVCDIWLDPNWRQ
ncbi:MAG: hypothetical protein ACTJG2_01340 [Candidatus Saccharimonadales bacterium]